MFAQLCMYAPSQLEAAQPKTLLMLPTLLCISRSCLQRAVEEMGVPSDYPFDDPTRAIFCNRTLNLRAIRAIGYDMDYTLIHYDTREWEGRAYEYGLKALAQMGIPTDGLSFYPEMAVRGLVVDSKKGNLLKVDRFGLVKRALHGDQMLSPADVQKVYGRELVHLSNSRWCFLNTLFSVSEGCLFMQVLVSSSSPQLCLLSQCHLH
jgi:hypothetical protein